MREYEERPFLPPDHADPLSGLLRGPRQWRSQTWSDVPPADMELIRAIDLLMANLVRNLSKPEFPDSKSSRFKVAKACIDWHDVMRSETGLHVTTNWREQGTEWPL